MKTLQFSASNLPVLAGCDAAVVGGSLAGVAAALALARAGRTVALIEPRTYLGYEITATLRPWLPVRDEYPGLLAEFIRVSKTSAVGGEIPLHPDAVKTCLENALLEAGVRLLYASQPVSLCDQGLIIGNKSGRQVIACQTVIDATPTALVARLSGAKFTEPPETAPYTITLEFAEVAFQEEGQMVENVAEWEIPAKLAGTIRRAVTHRGYRPARHGYRHDHNLIEITLELPRRADTPLEAARRYLTARRQALDFASYLLWENHHFRLAYLGGIAQDVCGPQVEPLLDPEPEWARTLVGKAALEGIPAHRFAAPRPNLWCLNDAARGVGDLFRDPIMACCLGEALGKMLGNINPTPRPGSSGSVRSGKKSALEIREPASPQRGRYPQIAVSGATLDVPVAAEVEVLVVGGGTSGAIAAIAAAQEGARTLVVEMNPGLGGTATYGGVHEYWAGYQHGFVQKSIAWVNKINDQLRYPRTYGLLGEWNIEAKTQSLAEEAQSAGAELLLNAAVIGAVVEGKRVRGVVAATPSGPVAVLGQVVIDATGDGDVAAFAGAEFTYGSTRDHAVMWFSLPQFHSPGHTNNNFTSMVDVSNVQDYTRAILSGRRRGQGPLHDHGTYVATRESRHIIGDVVQTLTDQLRQRAWPDVINLAVSNNDIKGQTSSDWMRVGLIPPNLQIENSYRMLLPRGWDGLLVVGKAVSVARDALSSIRMQPDFENLGGAAGLAAAQAVRAGVNLRQVDICRLQERLVEIGALPADVLTRQLAPLHYPDPELDGLIASLLADERPWRELSNTTLNEVYRQRLPLVEVVTAGRRVVPRLEAALEKARGPARVRAAVALALTGSASGAGVLAETLQARLSGDRLPVREAFFMHADKFAPDQAAMPDAAYLLYALGMTRDRRALPVWQRVADLLAFADEEDVWSQNKGVYAYVDALCLGTERLGDPAAIPILQMLHGYAPLRGKQLTEGFQADYLLERAAYIEVVIGRALARCGSPDGALVLVNYLGDVRALLAEQAHDELIAISGQDFSKDPRAWSEWLETAGDQLKPVPWDAPMEAVMAWGEEILRSKL